MATQPKPAPSNGKAQTNGASHRAYVILHAALTGIEVEGRAPGATGEAAIKAFTKQPDGSHMAGTWKAIPAATWDADGNNLVIETETKTVSSFRKLGRGTA